MKININILIAKGGLESLQPLPAAPLLQTPSAFLVQNLSVW